MRKGVKNVLVFGLLMLMLFSLLAVNSLAAKLYNVTVYYPGGGPPKDNAIVEAELNKYLAKKGYKFTVSLNCIDWAAWGDKTNLMITSGEPFDLMFTASWDRYTLNVSKGAFLPLDDYLNKYAKKTLKQIDSAYLTAPRINGKMYALPVEKEIGAMHGVLVNKKLADKYKFDFSKVKKIKDLGPFLKVIKENEPETVFPFLVQQENGPYRILLEDTFEKLIDHPGSIYKNATGDVKVVNEIETPEMKDAFNLLRDWYQKGYFNKDAATIDDTNTVVKSGNFLFWWQQLKPGKDAEVSNQLGTEMIQVPLTEPYQATGDAINSMMAVSRTSKDPKAAVQFLELLHTDKFVVNTVVFGVEGKHFVKVSNNIIKYPAGMSGKNCPYVTGNSWMMGSNFLNYLWENENPKKWDLFKDFNKLGKKSPVLGFIFDPENVKTEVATCTAVWRQYMSGFSSGTVDVDEMLPKFQKEMKAAGSERIVAEIQKQIDAFMAANKK